MAEKKSTKGKAAPKKRATKKMEEPKPVDEVQLAVEQVTEEKPSGGDESSDSLLGILGLSSASSVIITAILFLIGWSYISNWYGYFGIQTEETNTSIQQVLMYSMPAIAYAIFTLFASVCLLIAFIMASKLSVQQDPKPFTATDWLNAVIISMILLLLLGLRIAFTTFEAPNKLSRLMTISYEGRYLSAIGYGLLVALGLVISILVVSFLSAPKDMKQKIGILTSDISQLKNFPPFVFFSRTKRTAWILLVAFFYVLVMLYTSASIAFSNASNGIKGVGVRIQKVLYVSPRSLAAIKDFELSCDENTNCVYGPFGLIVENDNSFFLVQWKTDGSFPRDSGLYILPHNDSNGASYIVPAPTFTTTAMPPPARTVATPIVAPTLSTTPTPVQP